MSHISNESLAFICSEKVMTTGATSLTQELRHRRHKHTTLHISVETGGHGWRRGWGSETNAVVVIDMILKPGGD